MHEGGGGHDIDKYIIKTHDSESRGQEEAGRTRRMSVLFTFKTHDSESRGQEEAGRTRRMSVLFTGSTALKFVNALNKPPLKLSLSYQRLSAF